MKNTRITHHPSLDSTPLSIVGYAVDSLHWCRSHLRNGNRRSPRHRSKRERRDDGPDGGGHRIQRMSVRWPETHEINIGDVPLSAETRRDDRPNLGRGLSSEAGAARDGAMADVTPAPDAQAIVYVARIFKGAAHAIRLRALLALESGECDSRQICQLLSDYNPSYIHSQLQSLYEEGLAGRRTIGARAATRYPTPVSASCDHSTSSAASSGSTRPPLPSRMSEPEPRRRSRREPGRRIQSSRPI